VEKPHPRGNSSSTAIVIVWNAAKNISASDDSLWRTWYRNRHLLIEPLMRTRHIVIIDVFLENTDEMPLIQNQQVVKTLMTN
jgi:hypothetical protein